MHTLWTAQSPVGLEDRKKQFQDGQLSDQAREGLDLLRERFQTPIKHAAFTRCEIPSTTSYDIYPWLVMGLSFPAECLENSGSHSLSEWWSESACIILTTALSDECHCLCPSLEKSLLYKKLDSSSVKWAYGTYHEVGKVQTT